MKTICKKVIYNGVIRAERGGMLVLKDVYKPELHRLISLNGIKETDRLEELLEGKEFEMEVIGHIPYEIAGITFYKKEIVVRVNGKNINDLIIDYRKTLN